jgi:SAM-dependent methyltransferase
MITDSELRPACTVCLGVRTRVLMRAQGRDYWRCERCAATFLDARQLPAPDDERAHYALHENDPADAGYRRFLSRLADPLLRRLPPRQNGLDYGCGPGPALAQMLREAGHEVAVFDPFFAPDVSVLERTYDFVTCTEVAEHFHRPAQEFARLARLLRPGGWLAVMTSFQTNDARFAAWHYRRDPTHVVFYRAETFVQIAAQNGLSCEIPANGIALLRRATG